MIVNYTRRKDGGTFLSKGEKMTKINYLKKNTVVEMRKRVRIFSSKERNPVLYIEIEVDKKDLDKIKKFPKKMKAKVGLDPDGSVVKIVFE